MPRKELTLFSQDGKYALNWGTNGIVAIVSFETGKRVGHLFENEPLAILRAAFSRDMRRILCLNSDGTVAVWSTPRLYPKNIVHAVLQKNEKFSMRRMRTWAPTIGFSV